MKILSIICTLAISLLLLASCGKGKDDFFYKDAMLPVTIRGYNASNEALEVKLDTFRFEYAPNAIFDQTLGYSFTGPEDSIQLRITEKDNGKLVMEKMLKRDAGPVRISFLYMNGKPGDMPELPVAEAGKIKIKYMFRPILTNYNEPVDIVLGKYYLTPKVFEEIVRLKNVKPYEMSEPVSLSTFSTVGQQYNGQNTPVLFRAYIYKAGTNEFYTSGTAYTWHAARSTAPLPPTTGTAAKVYIFSESDLDNTIIFTKNLEL
ncbi:hypothetical protein ACTJJ0_05370 [Chitinophaga sp. 22321]|uniref:DUF4843 domain-containing protein n=1 Tax=Chitinophaga hostae TaxID=2831022 RepID=A0ABS5IZE4_9BACT|nr:hypothetical protein [Chitinophaga hostae]MBS0028314.1 hypothetical protein [Chitinophaga hostae]